MSNRKTLPFMKMQATGNDFVLIDNRKGPVRPDNQADFARKLSDRKYGIGSDGLILLEEENGELVMQYKNPDGSDAGMCGNGARCFVRFARHLGYDTDLTFRVHDKRYSAEDRAGGVTIRFPLRTFVTPMKIDSDDLLQVYTNTEHLVFPVGQELLGDDEELIRRGRALRHHRVFQPVGTNVNFIHGTKPGEVTLQTYERGVEDLTLACGTGAIAAALAWHHLGIGGEGERATRVDVRGGELTVRFRFDSRHGTFSDISLSGAATTVFEGEFYL